MGRVGLLLMDPWAMFLSVILPIQPQALVRFGPLFKELDLVSVLITRLGGFAAAPHALHLRGLRLGHHMLWKDCFRQVRTRASDPTFPQAIWLDGQGLWKIGSAMGINGVAIT